MKPDLGGTDKILRSFQDIPILSWSGCPSPLSGRLGHPLFGIPGQNRPGDVHPVPGSFPFWEWLPSGSGRAPEACSCLGFRIPCPPQASPEDLPSPLPIPKANRPASWSRAGCRRTRHGSPPSRFRRRPGPL